MTPSEFAAKWARVSTTERASARSHLLDLCEVLTELRRTRDSKHSVYALLIAHEKLDAAVAAAYGWAWPLTDDEILAALLALNHERSAAKTGAGREVAQALLQAAPSDAPPTQ